MVATSDGPGVVSAVSTDDSRDEFGDDRAERFASAMRDEVLGTTRWRTRF